MLHRNYKELISLPTNLDETIYRTEFLKLSERKSPKLKSESFYANFLFHGPLLLSPHVPPPPPPPTHTFFYPSPVGSVGLMI